MSKFLRSPLTKVLCCYLALFMAGLIHYPDQACASFIRNSREDLQEMDQDSLEALRAVLEDELLKEKLSELGLTKEEIIQRVEQLSPEERKIVLEKLDTIQSGGDSDWLLESLLQSGLVLLVIIVKPIESLVVIVTIYLLASAITPPYPNKRRVIFIKQNDQIRSTWKGDVEVFLEEPEENYIVLGRIELEDFKSVGTMLSRMKKSAAKNGANAIILENENPSYFTKEMRGERFTEDWKSWSARAIRIEEEEEDTR